MSARRFEVVYDKDFLKDVRRLSGDLQYKLSELIEVLQEDPFDTRLHAKPLSVPLQGMFSFRITRDYRVGFKFRALELLDLTIADKKNSSRLKELCRLREALVDYFCSNNEFASSDELWHKYFYAFNYAARVITT